MNKFHPKDFIAFATILAILLLKLKGINGTVDMAAALVLGYYFARRQNGEDKGE